MFWNSANSMIKCIEKNDIESFSKKYEEYKNKNQQFKYKENEHWTFLHVAAEHSRFEIIKKIFELNPGCEVNAFDSNGRTPIQRLFVNANEENDNLKPIRYLIERNAAIEMEGNVRPIIVTAAMRNYDTFKFILDLVELDHLKQEFGEISIAFHISAFAKEARMLSDLFKKGFDPNYKSPAGNMFSFISLPESKVDLVLEKAKVLVSKGVDMNYLSENGLGDLPIEIAIQLDREDDPKLTIFLMKNGLNLKCRNKNGESILDMAINAEKYKLATYFIRKGLKSYSFTKEDLDEIQVDFENEKIEW